MCIKKIKNNFRLKEFFKKTSREWQTSKKIKIFGVLFSAFIVTFLLSRRVFLKTLVFGDFPLIRLSSWTALNEYIFSLWHTAAHGEIYPSPNGYLILYFFSWIAWGLNNIYIFNFLMNLSLPFSFFAFYLFSSRFCESYWSRVFSATLYVVNPVFLTYYNFGGFMWAMVFLPLAFMFFMDLLETPNLVNTVKATIFITLTIWSYPTLSPIFLFVLFILFTYHPVSSAFRQKFLKRIIPCLFLLCSLTTISNLSYFFAQYLYSKSPLWSFEQSMIVRDFKYTYSEFTLLNFLRFAGNVGSPQMLLGYNNPLNVNNEIGLIIPIVAFMSVLFIKSYAKAKSRIMALLCCILFLCVLVLVIRIAAYSDMDWVIQNMPFIWTLRNPIKLQIMLAICMLPLFTFSVERIAFLCLKFIRCKKLQSIVLTCTLLILAISHVYIYNSFVFSGYMGLDKVYGVLDMPLPDETLCNIMEEASDLYALQNYRGIILPFDHRAELHVEFNNPLLYTGRIGHYSKILNLLNNELESKDNFTNMLRLLGIKYVYVNKAWKDSGFYILNPKNLADIVEILKNEAQEVANQSRYIRFLIEPTLPRLYLSSFPVFQSNIETIKFINASLFSNNPVFFQIKYNGSKAETYDTSTHLVFKEYYWKMPLSGTFDVYVLTYEGKQIPIIKYFLDGSECFSIKDAFHISEFFAPKNEYSVDYLGRFNFADGLHTLQIETFENDYSLILLNGSDTSESRSYSIEGELIKIVNGAVLTSIELNNFDLSVDFKPIKFGEETWHGPTIYFAWSNSSYFCIILHKDRQIELAKMTPQGYFPGIVVKQAILTLNDWNNLRLIKHDQTLTIYLNGEYLLSFNDPLLCGSGRIGIGSEKSATLFKKPIISENVVAGIWIFSANSFSPPKINLIKIESSKHYINFHQFNNSYITLVLNDNHDPAWKARLDAANLFNHMTVNTYANGWCFEVTEGTHTIEIFYEPNLVYQSLLYISITSVCILLVIFFSPVEAIYNRILEIKRRCKSYMRI